MKIVAFFAALLAVAPAFADQCAFVTDQQSKDGLQLIRQSVNSKTNQTEVLNLCELCGEFNPSLVPAASVTVAETGDQEAPKQILINGANADLAYTYARLTPRIWINVASQTSCPTRGASKYVFESTPGRYEIISNQKLIAKPAAQVWLTGKFISAHLVQMAWLKTSKQCRANGGKWFADSKLCAVQSSDDVAITKTASGGLEVAINTIGGGTNMCDFSGTAEVISPTKLLAKAETEKYVDGPNGKLTVIPATCEVSIEFKDANTVSATPTTIEECQSLCGAGVSLDIETAKRLSSAK